MSLPRYSDYKGSGIRWLGDVPAHWKVVSLRHLTDCLDGIRVPLNSAERADRPGPVPYWGANSVMDYVDAALLDEDLVLLGEDGAPFFDRDRQVAFFSQGEVWPNNHIHVLRPKAGCLAPFLVSALNATDFAPFIDGSTRDKLTQGAMNRIPIALPGIEEQQAIVSFLDRETAKIDALIAEQEKLLALLAEKRHATISHAVTRGLNPNAPMKDSGLPWLGEVPAHWNVLSLRRIARAVETGRTPSSEPPSSDLEDGLSWYTPGDFGSGLDLGESSKRVAFIQVESGEVNTFPPGSILIVSIGATLGNVGISSRVASANQQINAVVLNHSMDARFFAYSLSVKAEMMRFLSNASTIGIMNQSKTKEVQVAVPTNAEQVAIAAYLDTAITKIASLEAEVESAISLLKERRSALISAAVTGKIDVRHTA